MEHQHDRLILVILDGWGIGTTPSSDAISQALTPTMDALMTSGLHSTLVTHGAAVGLPDGQMGNSEVGHMHIGAGRVIYQDLLKISQAIAEGELAQRPLIKHMLEHMENKRLHLMGLVSDGGVHSHIDHLIGAMHMVRQERPDVEVFLHLFTDGRDTAPHGGHDYIQRVMAEAQALGGIQLASVIGRYYAMDRDLRWERTKKAYDLLVHGEGAALDDALSAIKAQYDQGTTDEFMPPMLFEKAGLVAAGDTVWFYNFRSDRPRQLTSMLVEKPETSVGTVPIDLAFYTMTSYDASYEGVHVIFDKEWPTDTLGEWLAKQGRTQLRVAETEKYPHVTYFMSGGQEQPFEREDRAMVHSPKVATYDLQPEMSARGVTDTVLEALSKEAHDFICVNYANADMVGHTGVFEAAEAACRFVDSCLAEVLSEAEKHGYQVIIIADHGNADFMINPDGSPHTAHTTNLVPCIYIDADGAQKESRDGSLVDVAPTILTAMRLPLPASMTGQSLIS